MPRKKKSERTSSCPRYKTAENIEGGVSKKMIECLDRHPATEQGPRSPGVFESRPRDDRGIIEGEISFTG